MRLESAFGEFLSWLGSAFVFDSRRLAASQGPTRHRCPSLSEPEERKPSMRTFRPSLSLVSPLCLTLPALLVSSIAWAQEDPTADPADELPVETAANDAPAPAAAPTPGPVSASEHPPAANASATVSAGGGGVVQMGDSGKATGPMGSSRVQTMGGSNLGSALAGGPVNDSDDEWKFDYHGYLRAPMRIGIGERSNAKTNQSVTTLSVPQIPTDQYIDWQYTQSAPRSTAEMFFSYGNSVVRGVTSIQAFRLSDSTWIDPTLQSGVTLAWVEVTPDLSDLVEDLRMNIKVGSFWSRYGGAGQYDAGAYETFVIGRTHTVGENIRIEYDYNDFVWFFEEGFGTKQPDPSPFHTIKHTLVAHAHAGFNWDQFLDVGLHYMHAWTQEQDHECVNDADEVLQNNPDDDASLPLFARYAEAPVGACKGDNIQVATDTYPHWRADSPDGSLQVIGADVVFNTASAGRLFLGGSHIIAKHAVTIAPAIEVIHAFGGGFFKSGVTHQYLNRRRNWDSAYVGGGNDGNGTITTLAFQWDLSVASLIELPQQLDLTAFGMLNMVKSKDDTALANVSKLKYGADLVWGPLSWFAAGFRFDRLQPRSDVPEQSFTVLAPRLIFRSDFATHEEISIGYARYLYGQRECSNYKPSPGSTPDPGQWGNLEKCVQPPNATIAAEGFGNRPGVSASKEFRGGPIDVESPRGGFPDQGWTIPHEHVFYISADIWW